MDQVKVILTIFTKTSIVTLMGFRKIFQSVEGGKELGVLKAGAVKGRGRVSYWGTGDFLGFGGAKDDQRQGVKRADRGGV